MKTIWTATNVFVLQDYSFGSHLREKLVYVLADWTKSHTKVQEDCIREGIMGKSRQIHRNCHEVIPNLYSSLVHTFCPTSTLNQSLHKSAFLATSCYWKCKSFLPKAWSHKEVVMVYLSKEHNETSGWKVVSIPRRDYWAWINQSCS